MATTIQSGRASSPLLTADVASRAEIFGGRGLVFDGVVDVAQTPSIDLGTTHSVSCWIKTSTGSKVVIGIDTSNFLIYLNSNLQIQYDATGSPVTSADALVSGAWNHVVVTRSGTTVNYYINGKVDSGGADTINSNDSLNGVFGLGGVSGFYFNGSMADVKFYSSALTEAEVQSQYLKPESVPSPSTLVAWYPMSEANPESPQSIVYDHSEKKLDTNLVTNGTFDSDISGWSVANPDSDRTISHATIGGRTCVDINDQSTGNRSEARFSLGTDVLEHGAVYKLCYYVRKSQADSTNKYYIINLGIDYIHNAGATFDNAVLEWDTWEYRETYIVAQVTNDYLQFMATSTGTGMNNAHTGRLFLDDVKLQKVLMGQNATTSFFEEQFTNGDMASEPTINGQNITHSNSSHIRQAGPLGGQSWIMTVTNGSGGGDSYLKVKPLDSSLIGATMNISIKLYKVSAFSSLQVRYIKEDTNPVNIGSAITANDTWTTVTGTVVGDGNSNFQPINVVAAGGSAGSQYYVDEISVKVVGISSTGFATAQNEPTIPQIPLVKYNEKMVFDKIDDRLSTSNIGTSAISTYSLWFNLNSVSGTQDLFTHANIYFRAIDNDLYVYSDFSNHTRYDNILTIGDSMHLVWVANSGTHTLYKNGVALTPNATTSSAIVVANNVINISSIGNTVSGIIDELSYFNTALSSTEVQELFNDGVALDATTHSKSANLIGYWRNDGITQWIDRSTNSNHGTVAGSPDSITIREGLNSNKDGLGFPLTNPTSNIVRFSRNGLAEHLSIPITKAFDIQGSFTVEFWMKQPDMGSGYQQVINRDDTTNRNWSVQSINGQISLGYYSGGSFSNTQTSGTYDDDRWHHVCAILTSGTSVQIYVDTVLVKLNTSSIPTTIDNDPAVLNIGKRTGTTQFFIGSIDEVRFYNKALTAFKANGSAPSESETATSGEVVKNYKHGKGKHKND